MTALQIFRNPTSSDVVVVPCALDTFRNPLQNLTIEEAEVEPRIGEPQLPSGDNPDFVADYINCNYLRVAGSLITPAVTTDRLWGRAFHSVGGTIPAGGSQLRLTTGWVLSDSNWTSGGPPGKIGSPTLTVVDSGIQFPANFLGWGMFMVTFQVGTWTGSAATDTYRSAALSIDPRFTSGFVYVRDSWRGGYPTAPVTGSFNWFSQVCTPTAGPVVMGLDFRINNANLSVPINSVQFEAILFPLKVID